MTGILSMILQRFYVLYENQQWQLKDNHSLVGAFESQSAAYACAVDAAKKAGDAGAPAEVLQLRLDNNQFRTVWTYGKNHYPPRF